MKKYFVITITIVLAFGSASAQTEYTNVKHIFDKKIPSIINYTQHKDNEGIQKTPIKKIGNTHIKDILKLNDETTAVLTQTYTDSIGGFHEVYKEYFKDIEVDGSKYALHYNDEGNIYRASGCFWTIENLNTIPKLNEKEALQYALKHIDAEKYAWDDKHSEKMLKEICGDKNATYFPKGKLLVHIKDNVAYLTYKFNINAVSPDIHYTIFVDACNGEIIDKFNNSCNATATVNTNYSGNYKTIQTSYDATNADSYILYDTTRGNGIRTRSWNRQDYTSDDNTWSNLSSYDRNALDVHWSSEMAYDYYVSKFGRNSLDGNGISINSLVNDANYNNASYNYVNSQNVFFQYGFRNYDTSKPYVSFDVIAHEFTHGVTDFSSQLANIDESAAINEGMSDIFAVSMEYWALPYKTAASNWQIGEDVYTLRDLSNPNCKYYTGDGWDFVNAEPHNNSGVFSYWCYLLTHGGTNSDSNITVLVPVYSIGLEKAIQICYHTNIYKLGAYSNYAYLAESTYESALELGYGTNVANEVRKAWYNVGVLSLNDLLYNNESILMENPSTPTSALSVKNANSQIEVSICFDAQRESMSSNPDNKTTWKLNVFNIASNEKIYSQEIKDVSWLINTTGWKSGLYIVQAIVNDKVISEKIQIR